MINDLNGKGVVFFEPDRTLCVSVNEHLDDFVIGFLYRMRLEGLEITEILLV